MLGNSAPTQFDLRFSLFGIPVRVHPLFWLFSAVMGWNANDFNTTFLWIGVVFVSILVHEFGHALTARFCRVDTQEIVLYSFGGYAAILPSWSYTTARSVMISFGGPAAGFILYGLVLAVKFLLISTGSLPADQQARFYVGVLFKYLEFINLWWGLVNLLPVYPLDGGRISRELLTHFRRRDGLEISLKLSILVGIGVAAYFGFHDERYAAILFAILALESWQHLAGMRYR